MPHHHAISFGDFPNREIHVSLCIQRFCMATSGAELRGLRLNSHSLPQPSWFNHWPERTSTWEAFVFRRRVFEVGVLLLNLSP